mmetsp:Transcript_55088/g.99277  ORF Transcript_55088/g.99277 Transcript_55088/m.99277 type:complete len:96 (+) Transcript_55088:316-603(+)
MSVPHTVSQQGGAGAGSVQRLHGWYCTKKGREFLKLFCQFHLGCGMISASRYSMQSHKGPAFFCLERVTSLPCSKNIVRGQPKFLTPVGLCLHQT